MKANRSSAFRPISQPDIPLPIGLRSVGHGRVGAGWRDELLRKNFVQLFWGIEGVAKFGVAGASQVLPAKSVFFYLPGDLHDIRAETAWEYRWMTLDGNLCVETLAALGLGRQATVAGECPEELFVKLTGRMYDVSPAGQRENAASAFRILTLACGGAAAAPEAAPLWLHKAVEIMRRDYRDPKLNINLIADRLGVHRTTLSRTFCRCKGIAANHYLQSCRVQKAMSLLKETGMTVAEVAYTCGFSDPDHFCKVIRRAAGMSPGRFRHG